MECMKFWKDGKAGLGCKTCQGDGACHYQHEMMVDLAIQDRLASEVRWLLGVAMPGGVYRRAVEWVEARAEPSAEQDAYWDFLEDEGVRSAVESRKQWEAERKAWMIEELKAWVKLFEQEDIIPF